MTRHNTLLLVVARRVARKLKDLSSEVLEYRREVDYMQVLGEIMTSYVKDVPGAPAPTRCA